MFQLSFSYIFKLSLTHAGQGMDALHPQPRLPAVEQDRRDNRHHLAVPGRAVSLLQQAHHADRLQEMQAGIPQRSRIPPLHPIDPLLPGQAAGHPLSVAPSDLPTPPLRQVLRDRVGRLPHGPPSSLVYLPDVKEGGPQIKACAYIGTSVNCAIKKVVDQAAWRRGRTPTRDPAPPG